MDITLIPDLETFPVPIGSCINWINGPKRIKTYALQCPNCNRSFCLEDHSIDDNGNCSPSVVCPFNCGLHTFFRIVK